MVLIDDGKLMGKAELKALIKNSMAEELKKYGIDSKTQAIGSEAKEGGVDFAVRILKKKTGRGSKATVYKMSHEGRIPCKKIGRKNLRFNGQELEKWIDDGMPNIGLIKAAENIAGNLKS